MGWVQVRSSWRGVVPVVPSGARGGMGPCHQRVRVLSSALSHRYGSIQAGVVASEQWAVSSSHNTMTAGLWGPIECGGRKRQPRSVLPLPATVRWREGRCRHGAVVTITEIQHSFTLRPPTLLGPVSINNSSTVHIDVHTKQHGGNLLMPYMALGAF